MKENPIFNGNNGEKKDIVLGEKTFLKKMKRGRQWNLKFQEMNGSAYIILNYGFYKSKN